MVNDGNVTICKFDNLTINATMWKECGRNVEGM